MDSPLAYRTSNELSKYRREIEKTKSLTKHKNLFWLVGNYLLTERLILIQDEYIQNLSALLNDIYSKAVIDRWKSNLQDEILDAVSKVGYLEDYIVKNPNGVRSSEFISNLKLLGKKMRIIGDPKKTVLW